MSALRESPTKYVEWQIEDFYNTPKIKNYILESPDFSLSGAIWYLSICPNGETEHHTSFRWVGMYLHKKDSARKYRVSYRIGIKKTDGNEFRYYMDENTFRKKGQGWGTSELLERSTLKYAKNVVDFDGSLIVFCNIRILNGPFVLPGKASQTSSSTAITSEAATQIPLPDTILEDASQALLPDTTLEDASQIPLPDTTLEDASQTPLPDTTLENASQTSLQATTLEAASETSSPNSITGEISVQSPSLKSMLTLVEDFKNIYNSRLYTDVIFSVKGEKFPVHRNVLAARSPVFASMFEHEFAEKCSGKVEISDCDPDLFNQFLLFLYTGKIDGLPSSKAVHLYVTADKYNVTELKEECVRCMIRDVSIDSFCDVIHLAVMHNDSDLLDAATDFFINNIESILPTTKWQDLLTEHPLLCNELLIKEIKNRMVKK